MLGPLLDADRVEGDGCDCFLDQFAGTFQLNPPIPTRILDGVFEARNVVGGA